MMSLYRVLQRVALPLLLITLLHLQIAELLAAGRSGIQLVEVPAAQQLHTVFSYPVLSLVFGSDRGTLAAAPFALRLLNSLAFSILLLGIIALSLLPHPSTKRLLLRLLQQQGPKRAASLELEVLRIGKGLGRSTAFRYRLAVVLAFLHLLATELVHACQWMGHGEDRLANFLGAVLQLPLSSVLPREYVASGVAGCVNSLCFGILLCAVLYIQHEFRQRRAPVKLR